MTTIRPALKDDAPAIHALHTASMTTLCVTHYPLNMIQRWIERRTPEGYLPAIDRGEMFVCVVEGQIAGFGHAVPGVIEAVFVHPAYAGQGIGSRLLAHGLTLARHDHPGPITLQATLNAQTFYAKHGFRAVKHYTIHSNDIDFAVVEMCLDPAP